MGRHLRCRTFPSIRWGRCTGKPLGTPGTGLRSGRGSGSTPRRGQRPECRMSILQTGSGTCTGTYFHPPSTCRRSDRDLACTAPLVGRTRRRPTHSRRCSGSQAAGACMCRRHTGSACRWRQQGGYNWRRSTVEGMCTGTTTPRPCRGPRSGTGLGSRGPLLLASRLAGWQGCNPRRRIGRRGRRRLIHNGRSQPNTTGTQGHRRSRCCLGLRACCRFDSE
jgi:hypothetical protein